MLEANRSSIQCTKMKDDDETDRVWLNEYKTQLEKTTVITRLDTIQSSDYTRLSLRRVSPSSSYEVCTGNVYHTEDY